jgi:two-component sensor histidine kinase/CheY-like chemotaxis protein
VLADPGLLRSQVLPQYRSALEAADAESSTNPTPFEHEFEVRLPSGEVRWLRLSSAPRRLPDGRIVWDGVQLDITEQKQAEERQRLLARELDHRAKNLLAVVQSILQLSRAEDIGSFVATVGGRVMALARAHSLLSDNRWEGGDLRQLVEEELAPYCSGAGRIAIDGPAAILTPAASQSLALALHELATNAARHGSLTRPTGRLAITWVASADGLRLVWDESRGPVVVGPPTRCGFGSTVIAASIRQGLQGDLALEWRPEGLRAVMFVPHTQLVRTGAVDGARTAHPSVDAPTAALAGRRILVVEDEPLVAMMAAAALEKAGCTVVGPAPTLAEALRLAEEERLDAAVLDRNLGGQCSDSVAERLRERGILFAVVTGYADTGLPLEFAGVPSLAKPFEPDKLVALVAGLVSPDPR